MGIDLTELSGDTIALAGIDPAFDCIEATENMLVREAATVGVLWIDQYALDRSWVGGGYVPKANYPAGDGSGLLSESTDLFWERKERERHQAADPRTDWAVRLRGQRKRERVSQAAAKKRVEARAALKRRQVYQEISAQFELVRRQTGAQAQQQIADGCDDEYNRFCRVEYKKLQAGWLAECEQRERERAAKALAAALRSENFEQQLRIAKETGRKERRRERRLHIKWEKQEKERKAEQARQDRAAWDAGAEERAGYTASLRAKASITPIEQLWLERYA